MIYLYMLVVFCAAAFALWVIMCGHYLLQRQRTLNVQWEYLSNLLYERNAILGDIVRLWNGAGIPLDASVAQLQSLLEQDAEQDGKEVRKRAVLREKIELAAQQAYQATLQQPQLAADSTLPELDRMLQGNGALVTDLSQQYNKSVQIYNAMLEEMPNDVIARQIGLLNAPYYRV